MTMKQFGGFVIATRGKEVTTRPVIVAANSYEEAIGKSMNYVKDEFPDTEGWQMSGDKESAEAFNSCIGKRITELELRASDYLLFTFEDGAQLKIWDDGQSCCKYRYMYTDDDLDYHIGATLQGAEVREGGAGDGRLEYIDNILESEFLIISTSNGQFTVVNYNGHSGYCGYYGGFLIWAELVEQYD